MVESNENAGNNQERNSGTGKKPQQETFKAPELRVHPDYTAKRVASMTDDEVDEALEHLGLSADKAIAAVRELLNTPTKALQARRRLHKKAAPVTASTTACRHESSPKAAPPSRRSAGVHLAAPSRGLSFVIGWNETHLLADRLRRSVVSGSARVEQEALLRNGCEHLGVKVGRLRIHCAADLDAAWPAAELLEETAIEVAGVPSLWESFASIYAGLTSSLSPPLQCLLVNGIKEISGRGDASQALAGVMARHILLRDPAPTARALLTSIASREFSLWHAIEDISEPLDEESRGIRVDIEETRRAAIDRFHALRAEYSEGTYFESGPVASLMKCLRGADPLAAFLAMSALGDVYLCAATLVAQDAPARRKEEHTLFAEKMLGRLRDDSSSHFFTVKTFEPLRDKHPRFAASLMARLAPSVCRRARQALMVCLVEGYEKSFDGRRQEHVPAFELDEPPRFIAGAPHALDLFGERICASEIGTQLRAEMAWANARLAHWRAG